MLGRALSRRTRQHVCVKILRMHPWCTNRLPASCLNSCFPPQLSNAQHDSKTARQQDGIIIDGRVHVSVCACVFAAGVRLNYKKLKEREKKLRHDSKVSLPPFLPPSLPSSPSSLIPLPYINPLPVKILSPLAVHL